MEIEVGTVVRHRRWGGRFTGTVTRRDADAVFVAWHGSFVEDELDVDEVEVCPDALAGLSSWRGGVGTISPDGTLSVEPAREP